MPTYSFTGYSPDALVYDAANNSWSLRPDYDPNLHRVEFSITDDDANLGGDNFNDETGNDANQTATVTDMNGNPVASGQVYDEEFYAISNPATGAIWIEKVEIAGQHVGYLVSAPLDPSLTYSQTTNMDAADDSPDSDTPQGNTASYSSFSDVPPCYAPGTMINTPDGPRAVEMLKPGDLVTTLDHGFQPIRWAHWGDHPLEEHDVDGKPVQIKAGALGCNLPANDLIVSPQHRILVGGEGQLQQVFASEAFAPAKCLTAVPGIRHMKGKTRITWIHFACERHEVVTANGCLSESLLLGPMVVNRLARTEQATLTDIFGPAPTPDAALNGPPARKCLTVGTVKRQIATHLKEKGALLAEGIQKWDRDLAMEKYEAERLREARSSGHPREKASRVA